MESSHLIKLNSMILNHQSQPEQEGQRVFYHQSSMYHQPYSESTRNANNIQLWQRRLPNSFLVSPPHKESYHFPKSNHYHYYQEHPAYMDETSLFLDNLEKTKQTKLTTNIKDEDNISLNSSILNEIDETMTYNTNHSIVKEKRKIKRETHNAVERKRRNNINDNIKCLGELLPEEICQGKINKGTILKGSVQYIRILKDQLEKYKSRLDYLEQQVSSLNI